MSKTLEIYSQGDAEPRPLPCPFCCCEVISLMSGSHPSITFCECGQCGAKGPVAVNKTPSEGDKESIRLWNNRGLIPLP